MNAITLTQGCLNDCWQSFVRACGCTRGQVDGKATDTLQWPAEGQDPLWSTSDRLFANTHLEESAYPREHDGMPGTEGGQGDEKSFVAETANALLLGMTQFSPNSMIDWMCDMHCSFSFLSLLFLFYEMGIIVPIPPEIIPSSWHYSRRLSYMVSFPGGSVVKNPPAKAEAVGNASLIPGSRRSPGVGNGYPLQYSCQIISWAEELGGLQSMESQSDTI